MARRPLSWALGSLVGIICSTIVILISRVSFVVHGVLIRVLFLIPIILVILAARVGGLIAIIAVIRSRLVVTAALRFLRFLPDQRSRKVLRESIADVITWKLKQVVVFFLEKLIQLVCVVYGFGGVFGVIFRILQQMIVNFFRELIWLIREVPRCTGFDIALGLDIFLGVDMSPRLYSVPNVIGFRV